MAVRFDNYGYRRGVVLGFTVAEIVLLFVFCLLLLLAPAALVTAPQQRIVAQSEQAGRTKIAQETRERTATQRAMADEAATGAPGRAGDGTARRELDQILQPPPPLPPDWNELVEGGKGRSWVANVCATVGLKSEECTPNALQGRIESEGRHNWPPIITLKATGEFFAVGRAEIPADFAAKIRSKVPELAAMMTAYAVNVIEVVGHTDEQPLQSGMTNLDVVALNVVRHGAPASGLVAADNAGLGYARALAVAQLLRADGRLSPYTIVPLSAAQLIDTDGSLSDGKRVGDVKERRRIDIRVRKADVGGTVAPVR